VTTLHTKKRLHEHTAGTLGKVIAKKGQEEFMQEESSDETDIQCFKSIQVVRKSRWVNSLMGRDERIPAIFERRHGACRLNPDLSSIG
jgi:hypothetical protein